MTATVGEITFKLRLDAEQFNRELAALRVQVEAFEYARAVAGEVNAARRAGVWNRHQMVAAPKETK